MKNTFKRVLTGLITIAMLAGMIPAGIVSAADFDTSTPIQTYIHFGDEYERFDYMNLVYGGISKVEVEGIIHKTKTPADGALTTLGELQGKKISDWFEGTINREPHMWRIWRIRYNSSSDYKKEYKIETADPTDYYIGPDETFTDAMLKAFANDKKSGTVLAEGGILIAEPVYEFAIYKYYSEKDLISLESNGSRGSLTSIQWYEYAFEDGGSFANGLYTEVFPGYNSGAYVPDKWKSVLGGNEDQKYGLRVVYDRSDYYNFYPVVISAHDGTIMTRVEEGEELGFTGYYCEADDHEYHEDVTCFNIIADVPIYVTVERRPKSLPDTGITTVHKVPIEGQVGAKFYFYKSGLYICEATVTDKGETEFISTAPWRTYLEKNGTTYNIKFDANGGSGSMPNITVGRKFTLPANGFTAPEGKAFRCWEVDGVEYKVGTELTASDNMVVKPVWDDPCYTVVYNFYDGTKETVQFEIDVETELLADTSVRVGYKFVGWSKSKYGSTADFAHDESVTNLAGIGETINLYPIFENVGTYTVYFRAVNGTSAVRMQDITVGVETPLLENSFTYDGYVFDYWSTATYGGGTRYTDKQTVKDLAEKNKSVNLYANWKKLPSFTVVFNANDGTGATKNQTIAIDAETALAENTFVRESYRFIGWNTSADGKGTSYEDKASVLNLAAENAKVNLYAVWEQLYTVSFDANGGTGSMTSVPNVKGDYVLPENGFTAPESTRFKCWSVGGAEKQVGDTITIADNTTVTAVWEQLYTVSFDANGGTGSMTSVPNIKGDYVLPENGFTAPDGMRFKTWSVGGAEKAVGSRITVNNDTVVKAIWEEIPVTFTISFNANGGKGTIADITDYSGDYVLPANSFTAPTGMRFKAWSVGGVEKAVGDKITVADNIEIKAIWEDIPTHTVTIVAGEGEGDVIEVTVSDTGKYTLPENTFTAPEGKRFKGWNVNGTAMNVGDTITVTDDTSITAIWEDIPTHTVTIVAGEGAGDVIEVTVGDTGKYTLPENTFTAPEGKRFKGWNVNGTAMNVGDTITVTDDTSITAIWENIPTHTVTIVAGEGAGDVIEVTVSDTGKYTLPENTFTAPEGKRFKGWNVNGTAMNVGDTITVTDDTSITAIWEDIPTHTITIVAGEGAGDVIEVTVSDTGKYTLPENTFTAPEGKRFKGWNVNGTAMNVGDTITVTDDTSITAIWENIPTHTITIVAGEASDKVIEVEIYDEGKFTLPENVFKAPVGKRFKCWLVDGVEMYEGDVVTVNSDTTVKAVWETDYDYYNNLYLSLALLYNRTFKISVSSSEGGSVTTSGDNTVRYAKDITYKITPAKGYEIKAVLVDGKDMGAVSEYTFNNVTKNHSIHAIFEAINPYTDVESGDWFYDDVLYVSKIGLMMGTGDNKFSPDITTDRAMLVTILWRLEGSPVVESSAEFTDVADGKWYTEAIDWASANGIVNGYGDGKFGPADQITREQIAAILYRYADYKHFVSEKSNEITAQYYYSKWAEKNVIWAENNGLFDDLGIDVRTLTEKASRAELAAYLHRFCENVID